MQKSESEAKNSFGIGERCHERLRKTFLKLREDFQSLKKDVLLEIATETINEALGTEVIVPSALVFGEFPSIRTFT